MGRNDLCFCGSGKKQKKCHIDIHEESIVAELHSLYNEIDTRVEKHFNDIERKPYCHKGCSNCCSDYFTISNIEFDVLLDRMKTWDKDKRDKVVQRGLEVYHNFKNINPKYCEKLDSDVSGDSKYMKEAFLKDMEDMPISAERKCPFLDENGSCMVYDIRPIICRIHGVAFTEEMEGIDEANVISCGHVSSIVATDDVCDLTDLGDKAGSFWLLYSNKFQTLIMRRQRPIFYYFYYQYEKYNYNLDVVNYDYKFKMSKEMYVNHLYDRFYNR